MIDINNELPTPKLLVSYEDAVKFLGITQNSMSAWISDGKIEFKRDGNRKLFSQDVLDLVKKLREERGSHHWYKHAPWYVAPAESDEVEETEEVEEAPAGPSLAQKLIAKAKELKANGDTEVALVLYELVLDHCDFTGVE
jgi:hypothetical protein